MVGHGISMNQPYYRIKSRQHSRIEQKFIYWQVHSHSYQNVTATTMPTKSPPIIARKVWEIEEEISLRHHVNRMKAA